MHVSLRCCKANLVPSFIESLLPFNALDEMLVESHLINHLHSAPRSHAERNRNVFSYKSNHGHSLGYVALTCPHCWPLLPIAFPITLCVGFGLTLK